MLHPAPYVSAKHNVVLQTATAANIRPFIVGGLDLEEQAAGRVAPPPV